MFNEVNELNLKSYKPETAKVIEKAIMFALESSSRKVSFVEFLAVLVKMDTADSEYSELGKEAKHRLKEAHDIILNSLNKGIGYDTCVDGISSQIVQDSSNRAVNYFSKDAMDGNLVEFLIEDINDSTDAIEFAGKLFKSLHKLDKEVVNMLSMLVDINRISNTFDNIINAVDKSEIYTDEGLVDKTLFEDSTYKLLEDSMKKAFDLGYSQLNTYHILLGIMEGGDSLGANAMRKCLPMNISMTDAIKRLEGTLKKGNASPTNDAPKTKDSHTSKVVSMLKSAQNKSIQEGEKKISDKSLLQAFFITDENIITTAFKGSIEIASRAIIEAMEAMSEKGEDDIDLPLDICTSSLINPKNDETQTHRTIGRKKEVDDIFRVFFRKAKRNVLLFGEKGVGKSVMANAIGEHIEESGFLKGFKVIYMNAEDIEEKDLCYKCRGMFEYMENNPKRIYVVDGFYRLMKGCAEICKRYLKKNNFYFAGIVSNSEKVDLSRGNDLLNEYFESIEIDELKSEYCNEIVKNAMERLEKEYQAYNLTFEKELEKKVVKLSKDFIISKRFPQKAIELISLVCSNVTYDAKDNKDNENIIVTKKDVAEEVSKITGMPTETILGTGKDLDYVSILKKGIMGQDRAVEKVAKRLDMIQKGMTKKEMPQAIFLFVGLSGTGKTELAKEIAKVYSSSRTLITYPMQNFKEAHNISGIMGTSVGYKGYENGGKLINDLNRDPYSVVLFDEIEKAHPDIWDPFLHLFDEGEITDLTGNTAYANKSFLVLTSNIGYQKICNMLKDDKSIDEIEEAVLAELYAAVNPRTNELCLRPEFLGRIVKNGEIIVFNPLTLEAMTMITGKLLDKEIAEWNEARDSQMIVENEVIEYIGKKCFAINEKDLQAVYKPAEYSRAGRPQSVQYKGGRIIHSMINKFIMDDLVKNVIKYSQSLQVRVKLDGDDVVIECIEDEKILEGKTNEDIEKIRISIQEIKTQIDTEFTKLLAKKDEDEVKEIYEAINSLKNTLEE